MENALQQLKSITNHGLLSAGYMPMAICRDAGKLINSMMPGRTPSGIREVFHASWMDKRTTKNEVTQ